MGFTFVVTYMRTNSFFSYEIFSLNSMWMFFMAFLYLFVIIFALYFFSIAFIYFKLYEPLSNIIYILKECHARNKTGLRCRCIRRYVNWLSFFVSIYLIVCNIIVILLCCHFACTIKKITITCFIAIYIISTIVFFLIPIITRCCEKAFIPKVVGFIVLVLYTGVFVVALYEQDISIELYKKFLQSRGLVSDHAEIYLKNENKSVPGKLIFDDGKYAYVEFNRTDSNCGGIGVACEQIIRKKVPSEDVSILVPLEQQ